MTTATRGRSILDDPFDFDTPVSAETITVHLKALSMPKANMIRTRLEWDTVHRYATLMRAGTRFPPITIMPIDHADVTKGFTLVDGWHRVRAAQENGLETIEAVVITGEINEVPWMAYEANCGHGLNLKMTRVMRREIFRAYVKARKHRTGKARRLKTVADMARDLIGVVSVRQLPSWIAADFPSIYKQLNHDSQEEPNGPRLSAKDMNALYAREAHAALDNAMACIRHLDDGRMIRAVVRKATECLTEITEASSGRTAWPEATEDETNSDF